MSGGVTHVLGDDGQADQHCFQIGDMGAASPRRTQPEPMPVAATQLAPVTAALAPLVASEAHKPAPADAALTARQLIAKLKTRLRVVEREIKARRQLESERDQLKRLMHAALTERDNVRRLRSAG